MPKKDLISYSGNSYLVHPWTGDLEKVPEAEARERITAGYMPASLDQVQKMEGDAFRNSTLMKSANVGIGIARGLTGGISDLALRAASPEIAKQYGKIEKQNKAGSIVGDVIGTGIGMATSGPAGLLNRGALTLGKKITSKIAQKTGKSATSFLPRMAGGVSREATTGAGLGFAMGTSELALGEKDITAQNALKTLAETTGKGALIGSLWGGHSELAKLSFNQYVKRASRGRSELIPLKAERQQLKSQISSMKTNGAAVEEIQAIEKQLASNGVLYKSAQKRTAKIMLNRAIGMGIGSALGAGPIGAGAGFILAPMAFDMVKKVLKPLGKDLLAYGKKVVPGAESWIQKVKGGISKADDLVAQTSDKATQLAKKMGPETEALLARAKTQAEKAGLGKALDPLQRASNEVAYNLAVKAGEKAGQFAKKHGEKLGQFAKKQGEKIGTKLADNVGVDTLTGAVALESAGHAVGSGFASLVQAAPEKAYQGFMLGGLTGAGLAVGAHYAKRTVASRLTNIITQSIAPTAEFAGLKALTNIEYSNLLEDFKDKDEELGFNESINDIIPINAPGMLRESIVNRATMANDYLSELAQQLANNDQIPTSDAKKQHMSDASKSKLGKMARAVIDPDSLVESFADGSLSKGQITAWKRVYPEALRELQNMVKAEVDQAKAAGGYYDKKRAQQISLLLGDEKLVPRMYQKKTIQRLQSIYSSNDKQGPKPRPKRISGLANSSQTFLNRALSGEI